jgi:ferredoxin
MVKLTVDQERCCGAGTCVMLVPEVFDQREEDGVVVLLDATPADDKTDGVRNAAAVCPTAAITLDDGESIA